MNTDSTFDAAALKNGERLFRGECHFIAGATAPTLFPEESLPEIAFAGRSNVGKSSLINALTFRKKLARASNTPGRTQQINFFDLGGRLRIVDLPGYGFAAASKEKNAAWTGLIRTYLKHRISLALVCLLVDARHGFKDTDFGALGYLAETGRRALVILTKCDKVKAPALADLKAGMEGALHASFGAPAMIYETSAETGAGIPELRTFLSQNAIQTG